MPVASSLQKMLGAPALLLPMGQVRLMRGAVVSAVHSCCGVVDCSGASTCDPPAPLAPTSC